MLTVIFYLAIFNTIINLAVIWYEINNEFRAMRDFDFLSAKMSIIYKELSDKIERRTEEWQL